MGWGESPRASAQGGPRRCYAKAQYASRAQANQARGQHVPEASELKESENPRGKTRIHTVCWARGTSSGFREEEPRLTLRRDAGRAANLRYLQAKDAGQHAGLKRWRQSTRTPAGPGGCKDAVCSRSQGGPKDPAEQLRLSVARRRAWHCPGAGLLWGAGASRLGRGPSPGAHTRSGK